MNSYTYLHSQIELMHFGIWGLGHILNGQSMLYVQGFTSAMSTKNKGILSNDYKLLCIIIKKKM